MDNENPILGDTSHNATVEDHYYKSLRRKLRAMVVIVIATVIFCSSVITYAFIKKNEADMIHARLDMFRVKLEDGEAKIKTLEQELSHVKLFNYELEHKLMKCMER